MLHATCIRSYIDVQIFVTREFHSTALLFLLFLKVSKVYCQIVMISSLLSGINLIIWLQNISIIACLNQLSQDTVYITKERMTMVIWTKHQQFGGICIKPRKERAKSGISYTTAASIVGWGGESDYRSYGKLRPTEIERP